MLPVPLVWNEIVSSTVYIYFFFLRMRTLLVKYYCEILPLFNTDFAIVKISLGSR